MSSFRRRLMKIKSEQPHIEYLIEDGTILAEGLTNNSHFGGTDIPYVAGDTYHFEFDISFTLGMLVTYSRLINFRCGVWGGTISLYEDNKYTSNPIKVHISKDIVCTNSNPWDKNLFTLTTQNTGNINIEITHLYLWKK